MRLRFKDFRNSQIPELLGRCRTDTPALLDYVNEATQRLLLEDESGGFWNLNQKMAFNVDANKNITAPREVARISDIAVCSQPIRIQNQFFEFLYAGDGLRPANGCDVPYNDVVQALDRGTVVTQVDLPTGNFYLRAYHGDARDIGKKITIAGLDQNGHVIREQHGINWDFSFDLTFASPFATSTFLVSKINAIAKDVTYEDVLLYAVDATTGVETLLARYAADETGPEYRRYYLDSLPSQCCNAVTPVQVVGLVKLAYVPVRQDSDFLLINNLISLKEECLAIKYNLCETETGYAIADRHHKEAIRLLNRELKTMEGPTTPAINVAIHGTAKLRNRGIGTIY